MSTTEAAAPAPAPAPTRRPRTALVAGAVALVVVVVGGVVWWLGRADADASVPYDDPQSAGALTLCDANGHRITSGSVSKAPFVARAVGPTAASEATGTTATLYAYQPREGLAPGEWSGKELTSATTYPDATHPIGQFTVEGPALTEFTGAFPVQWDGLVQLRLYVTSPTYGIARTYDTVDLRIDGDRWEVAGKAGATSCAGEATSFETTTLNYKSATR